MNLQELRQFHTSRCEKSVVVTIEKSTTPMLWLDTSVLVDFAKLEKGENIEPVRAKRLTRLRSVVRQAVRDERLVCPEWDQDNEYEAKRLEADIRRIVSDLSCGAHCIPYAGVKDQQILIGMRAYIAAVDAMHIPANIHFYKNPLEAIREAKRNRYIVECEMPKPAEWIDKAARDKLETQESIEELRQGYTAKDQTFEQQLNLERIGESDVMIKMVGEYMGLVRLGQFDFWKYMGVVGFVERMDAWQKMGGPSSGLPLEIPALYSFMRSPYYWELPIQDISCRLSADLLVKDFRIKSGDGQDIQHLATAIPVAHFVVADKAMVDRCERLGIGKKWNAKLFSNRMLDDLSDEVACLS
ncbi:MAG: hypothetical protein ABSF85_00820 [Terriglobales bacterium]|jgi:hypothetical protein